MTVTIDLPSGAKIIIYPLSNKAHFIFPFTPPITLSLKQAERVCREVAAEKSEAQP